MATYQIELATGERVFMVRQSELGETRNWSSSVNYWEQYWTSRYLTTIRSGWWLQFIEFMGGGDQFEQIALAAGGDEGYRLRDYVSTAVAGSPALMRQP